LTEKQIAISREDQIGVKIGVSRGRTMEKIEQTDINSTEPEKIKQKKKIWGRRRKRKSKRKKKEEEGAHLCLLRHYSQ
jgi:hypothetical protein